MNEDLPAPRVIVIGGGVSGLAAAHRVATRCPAAEITVLEATDRIGGLLHLGAVGGALIDLGAESVLARRPEAVDLIRAVGLGDDLTHPVLTRANVVRGGALHPLPARTMLGVPADPATLAGLFTPQEMARAAADPQLPVDPVPADGDVSVASWVSARVGRAVVDHLVEPLLGGVYAGHADLLSLRSTVPALWPDVVAGRPALAAVAAKVPAPSADGAAPTSPVFAGIRGGLGRLPLQLAHVLRGLGVRVLTGTRVVSVTPGDVRQPGARWQVTPDDAPPLPADAVIVALPAPEASRVLAGSAPLAAEALRHVECADVAVIATVVPRRVMAPVPGSGVLVPPVAQRLVKAMTFSSAKWEWVDSLDPDHVVVRLSVGRHRDPGALALDDEALLDAAVADAGELLGRPLTPIDRRLVRWDVALPQPLVGHHALVARVRADAAARPGLAVAGAVMDGVGIPACIQAATRAADEVLADPRFTDGSGVGAPSSTASAPSSTGSDPVRAAVAGSGKMGA